MIEVGKSILCLLYKCFGRVVGCYELVIGYQQPVINRVNRNIRVLYIFLKL